MAAVEETASSSDGNNDGVRYSLVSPPPFSLLRLRTYFGRNWEFVQFQMKSAKIEQKTGQNSKGVGLGVFHFGLMAETKILENFIQNKMK